MRYRQVIFSLLLATMLLSATQAAQAALYIYKGKDGTRWITDRPMEDQGFQLLRRLDYKRVAQSCDGLSRAKLSDRLAPYEMAISTNARVHSIDRALIKAVIHVESCFNPKAISRAGAVGLMQLMPATAKRYGVRDRYNPTQNIRGGVKYLKYLKSLYRNDLRFMLAAYNAGEGAVKKYNDIPPYKETRNYVKRVMRFYERYKYDHSSRTLRNRKNREEFVKTLRRDKEGFYD
ncbi:MAG: hypothetical protein BMS9Abin26_2087 [Gammaproteobacteria bacterium]|nr:MAG: hypothetical protein BMS9Abin26_2087 [Gammaproteobacteria bacterium]